MSRADPNRRRALAAGATLLLAGPAALTGCTLPVGAPEGPDPLEAPARRADADAALAAGVAQLAVQTATQKTTGTAAHAGPVLAAAARAFAADRMAHATMLRAELRRVRPGPASSSASPPIVPLPFHPDLASTQGVLAQAARAA
ncbi:MAG TPA: hypothetical protein VK784_07500, partial [Pseudonocardiaceae bacterium]|nr:hypothetical protein [Pseudonocardiaceae bacterium]